MAYNVPTYDTTRFSFGPGVLYMGAPGTTPLIEVGAVKGNPEFSIERTLLEVFQGSPKSKVAQYATKEVAILKVSGIEWNFDNLAYALGAGVTGINGTVETFEFGGDMSVTNRALRFVHRTPDGSTIDLHLFKAEGSGKIAVAFNEEDTHEFPFEFHTLEGTTDFAGSALAANKKHFKIIRTKA
ncbi:MAG: hypothetical protein HY761_10055 [Candidatus Omnitrophica bacterium]|nr:hypothetical protein [Candidatus Omnitrophota bacterium]